MNLFIKKISGKGIPVRGNNIDTDRIIPARFMKCVTFDGLGSKAFHDERVDVNGRCKNHSFDDKRYSGHSVLVSNANFGCGSSREHAPQALKDWGIGALICESFAEIFAGNCSSLGMPAVSLARHDIEELQCLIENSAETEIGIDLETMVVRAGGRVWTSSMPEAYRNALMDGSWDSIVVLSRGAGRIDEVAAELPYM